MQPFQRLLVCNKGRGAPLCVAAEGDESVIYLYDAIVPTEIDAQWWGGVAADTFAKTIMAINTPFIHLRINSPGGDVFAGRAIAQAIKDSPSTVIAHVDGYAASAASYIALAADEVQIAEGGFFMIHQAWSLAYGNSDDMLGMATLLEKIDSTLVQTYQKETGNTPEQIQQWMSAETWFTADEAVQYGFADSLQKERVKNSARWDLSAYKNAPVDTKPEDKEELDISPARAHFENMRRRLQLAAHV
jgi:ATP-dependent Clp protease protease subunit